MFIFSFKRCETESEAKRVKKVYAFIFIILFIASIIIVSQTTTRFLIPIYEELGHEEFVNIEEESQKIKIFSSAIGFVSIFFQIFLFYVTIWACYKLGMGKITSILWGIVALWPFVSIVPFIVVLSRKITFKGRGSKEF